MKTLVAFIIIVSVYFISCRADDQPCVNCPSTNADTMILRTDEFGNILGGDTTDWCYRDTGNVFKFGPAFPNPAINACNISFYVPTNDTVSLYFPNGGDTVFLMNSIPVPAGYFVLTFNNVQLNFHYVTKKLCIRTRNTYTTSSECNLCGDIRFND